MKKIEAFKTSDGKVFESEADAKKHQQYLDQWDLLDRLLETTSVFIDGIEDRKELIELLMKVADFKKVERVLN